MCQVGCTRNWISKKVAGLVSAAAVSLIPSLAFAAPTAKEPTVAMYTLLGLFVVFVAAVVFAAAMAMAHRMRLISGERRVRLGRRLRVAFGAGLLLAMVTPYVAFHFSPSSLVPFVAGSGVLVGVWAWSASRQMDAQGLREKSR